MVFDRSSVSGPSSLPICFAAVPSGDFIQQHRARGGHAHAVLRVDRAGSFRDAGNRHHLHRRHDGLLGRALVDVREAHLLHRVEVIEIAPEFLEAVRRRQRIGVIAEVVLAELAGGVALVEQELADARRSRAADTKWRRATAAGACPRDRDVMPVTNAQRPAVQLDSA